MSLSLIMVCPPPPTHDFKIYKEECVIKEGGGSMNFYKIINLRVHITFRVCKYTLKTKNSPTLRNVRLKLKSSLQSVFQCSYSFDLTVQVQTPHDDCLVPIVVVICQVKHDERLNKL